MTVLLVFCWMATAALGTTLYSIQSFGPAEGEVNIVTDLNNRGQVVGDTFRSTGSGPPFLFSNGAVSLEWPTAGRFWAINDSGVAVGSVSVPGGQQAVIHSGGVTSLMAGVPGTSSAAMDVNNRGDIVGWLVQSPGTGERPFLYRDGVFTDLGAQLAAQLGAGGGIANTINNNGMIAGTFGPGGFTGELFLFNFDRAMALGTNAAVAYSSLNDAGGLSFECGLWLSGRLVSAQELGFCPEDINSRSEVVGWNRSDNTSWIWANGVGTRLDSQLVNGAGWSFLRAMAINDVGQIAGTGSFHGVRAGFLMTPVTTDAEPVPEPAPAGILGAAILFLLGIRRWGKPGTK